MYISDVCIYMLNAVRDYIAVANYEPTCIFVIILI